MHMQRLWLYMGNNEVDMIYTSDRFNGIWLGVCQWFVKRNCIKEVPLRPKA